MSISLIGSPDDFAPGYNPVWWYFDSTNKNKASFRYVIDLYEKTGFATQELIARYRIAPRPGDGYGGFNVNKVLSSYLTNQLPDDLTGGDASDSYISYNIEIGEEFGVTWDYDDYEFYSAPGDPYNAYTKLRNFGTNTHTFVPGDQIDIVSDSTPPFDFTGLHTVVAIPDTFTIVIDKVFAASGPTIGGDVTYANNEKGVFPNLLTVSNKTVFNGAMSHSEYNTYVSTAKFGLSTVNLGQAVSTIPATFNVRPDTIMVLNFFGNFSNELTYLYGENDTGTVRRRGSLNTGIPLQTEPVGPDNIDLNTLVSGSGDLIQPGTEWYKIWVADGAGVRTSQEYTFQIGRKCTNYREFQAVFLDRLGSLGSFSFIYRNEETQTSKRESHKFLLGDLSGSAWTYSNFDAGTKTINVDAETDLILRTAWLTEAESEYFKELVTSGVVWLSEDGGDLYPATVQTNTIQVQQHPVNKNLKYEIRFKMANNEIINW